MTWSCDYHMTASNVASLKHNLIPRVLLLILQYLLISYKEPVSFPCVCVCVGGE